MTSAPPAEAKLYKEWPLHSTTVLQGYEGKIIARPDSEHVNNSKAREYAAVSHGSYSRLNLTSAQSG